MSEIKFLSLTNRMRLLSLTRNKHIPLTLRKKLISKKLPPSGDEFSIDVDGMKLQGRLNNYIDRIVYGTGCFFEYTYLNLFKKLVPHPGVVLDIGANVGNHAIFFSGYAKTVQAFEPYPPVYDELRKLTATIDTIKSYPIALSDKNETLSFSQPDSGNLGTGKIVSKGDFNISAMRGDDFIRTHSIEQIGLIKIDVEGHELEVIAGLQSTINSLRPVIVFEIPSNESMSRTTGFKKIRSMLPPAYRLMGLRSQSTFPIQKQTALPIQIKKDWQLIGCKIGIAIPQ